MRHLLVSSGDAGLVDVLRAGVSSATVVLSARGVDETLERLARSARVDAVVTDDPDVLHAIRSEIPGSVPVVLVPAGAEPAEALSLLRDALPGV